MNQERAKELLPVFTAFIEGKSIQYKSDGIWIDVTEPNWMSDVEYRAEPAKMVVYVDKVKDDSNRGDAGKLYIHKTKEMGLSSFGRRQTYDYEFVAKEFIEVTE